MLARRIVFSITPLQSIRRVCFVQTTHDQFLDLHNIGHVKITNNKVRLTEKRFFKGDWGFFTRDHFLQFGCEDDAINWTRYYFGRSCVYPEEVAIVEHVIR